MREKNAVKLKAKTSTYKAMLEQLDLRD